MSELEVRKCPACVAARESNAALGQMAEQLQKERAQLRSERDQLRLERDEARAELADRKVIERAKGFLMEKGGWTENDTYGLMRRAAMNRSHKLVEVARWVLNSPPDVIDSYVRGVNAGRAAGAAAMRELD